MADRLPELSKNISKNRKKKKNKRSKKKSATTESCLTESNFSRESKYESPSGETIFQSDNYEDNKNVVENQLNGQDSLNFKNRTQRYNVHEQGKHNRHDPSNFGVNRFSSRNLHDEENSLERNHATARKTHSEGMFPKNKFANHDFHPFGNPQASLQNTQYLRIEIERLTQENERLKDTLNDIQYNWSLHSNSDIDIIFKKRHIDEKFSYVLNDLVSKLLNGSISIEDLSKFCSVGKCEKEEKSSEPLDECLFAVDSSAETHQSGNVSVPIYDASFHEILESPGDNKNASPSRSESGGRFAKSCFNCGENHHMGSCPRRLDFRKIAIAKKRAKSNFVPNVRYHVHGKNENDFKPGIISDELRDALGIRKNQIPPYVYRMRVLDYPPGWLCEAAVESSGMVLYDSEGKAIKEDNCADGDGDLSQVRVQYDPDKLIDYPGFNVPLPPDMIDESVELGLPPLQTHQLRCFVEQYMPKPSLRPSRKRKITLESDRPSKQPRNEEDMEIEDSDEENADSGNFQSDFVPPLPESEPPPPPPPPPPGESNDTSQDLILSKLLQEFNDDNSGSFIESSNDHFKHKSSWDLNSGTSSPSLAELEELKKKLVMELGISVDDNPSSEASQDIDCNNTSSNLNECKEPEDFFILEDECIGSEEDCNELSNISDSNSTHNKSGDGTECHKSFQRTTSQSKSVVLGTPSLSRHSPYVKLPDYEQFSKNVSSHIPFENLPNSTGTYEKLKGVLKTVKKKFNELMK